MRVLVVEDDPALGPQVQQALTAAGYAADLARDGEEGEFMGATEPYDAVVLDLGLPRTDGLTVLRRWRGAGQSMPVIVLTARSHWHEKVEGIDAGADDYLTKPFRMEELLARVRALMRKVAQRADTRMRIADLVLDTKNRKVERGGRPIDLSTKEFALLQYLMENRGSVLSRMDISEKVWDIHFDTTTNVIDVHINRLRKKVDADFPVKLIQTVRGAGYTLGEE